MMEIRNLYYANDKINTTMVKIKRFNTYINQVKIQYVSQKKKEITKAIR